MRFTHYKLGHVQAGQVVEVTLSGNAANVRLMNSSNFQLYKRGKKHKYYGGRATKSPVRLQIPSTGQWHVAIDMQGLRGQVRTGIRMMPGALPKIKEPSLASVPSLVRNIDNNQSPSVHSGSKSYDVFISHASEDKAEIVGPQAQELRQLGLDVWYDEFELRIGDSLRQKIDKGLANSRFGIVVLSKEFIRKGWTNYELDGIVTMSVTGEQIMLPIWHNITKQEVIEYSPSLADKVARNTASYTIIEIAAEIADVIQNSYVNHE